MSELTKASNIEFLQELRKRVAKKKLNPQEILGVLEVSQEPELITEYKKTDYSKLTKEDWKKACQALEDDKVYQEEIKLWESVDDEQENN